MLKIIGSRYGSLLWRSVIDGTQSNNFLIISYFPYGLYTAQLIPEYVVWIIFVCTIDGWILFKKLHQKLGIIKNYDQKFWTAKS